MHISGVFPTSRGVLVFIEGLQYTETHGLGTSEKCLCTLVSKKCPENVITLYGGEASVHISVVLISLPEYCNSS